MANTGGIILRRMISILLVAEERECYSDQLASRHCQALLPATLFAKVNRSARVSGLAEDLHFAAGLHLNRLTKSELYIRAGRADGIISLLRSQWAGMAHDSIALYDKRNIFTIIQILAYCNNMLMQKSIYPCRPSQQFLLHYGTVSVGSASFYPSSGVTCNLLPAAASYHWRLPSSLITS